MTGDESGEASGLVVEQTARLDDFQRERKRLVRLAYRMLGSFSEAEDVVQDAFVSALCYGGSFRGDATTLTWLYRIVMNTSIDHCRKRGRREHRARLPEIAFAQQFQRRANSQVRVLRHEHHG